MAAVDAVVARPSAAGRCRLVWPAAMLLIVGLSACEAPGSGPQAAGEAPTSETVDPLFVDDTVRSGVDFVHRNASTEERYLPETMGAGVAVFDANGDDVADLLLLNGIAVDELGREGQLDGPGPALYLGRGDGTFEDRSKGSGLEAPLFAIGVAVGDLDNDGDNDVVLTTLSGERLFLGRGDGRFDDATAGSGLGGPGFGSSAALLDYDRDGLVDLFAGRYVRWSPQSDIPCRLDRKQRNYCTPEAYPAVANRLYRNLGGGRFEDVSEISGIAALPAKTLGVAVLDLEPDLLPDLVVASDTAPNQLWRNRGDGTFEEIGIEVGIALGASGSARGAMGVEAADLDGDLRTDLVFANFAQEMASVYRASELEVFLDEAAHRGVGLPTLMPVSFGLLARDLDLDGWIDLVFANGHIEPRIAALQPGQSYAQEPVLLRGSGAGGFAPMAGGAPFQQAYVARGLASGDLDGDGDLDLVLTQNGAAARVWSNQAAGPSARALRLRLQGAASNRSGFGARIELSLGGREVWRWLVGGGSYLSASEPVLTVGVGALEKVERATLVWPSGMRQELSDLSTDRLHVINEPATAASDRPRSATGRSTALESTALESTGPESTAPEPTPSSIPIRSGGGSDASQRSTR
ncbi:MAG: CRTAC1 family protein [Acidobacteria bacterium]|nr:MAG: CRTAC1 family protein [Acidobacteriota bacterium]REK07369.1 MAG: CRTAC1 family protein [Acidobacteriota bacterium]